MLIRIYAKMFTPLNFKITDSNGIRKNNEETSSLIHTCIFENQLKLPPKFSNLENDKMKNLKSYRLQEWVLVDFDKTMNGHPFVYKQNDSENIK